MLVVPASATADAPPLRGAATHPLWLETTVEQFDRELDLLKAAGANTVRIDIAWSTLELGGDGQLDQNYVAKADTFFDHAAARGIKPIVTLFTTPCWASSAPPDVKQNCAGAWWDRLVQYYPPTDPNTLADIAGWIAQRWGGRLAAMEIWNEPNFPDWFKTTTPAQTYAAMLRASYTRIKQVRPSLPVLGPAMFGTEPTFLQSLYDAGIGGYFDGLSVRPFSDGRSPYDIPPAPWTISRSFILGVPTIRNVMVANGDAAKKMWFTELGWSSCYPGPSAWCITPELQARYLTDAFLIIRDKWNYVQSVSVYLLRNKGTDPLDRETQMGLVYEDFTPKPSYYAFRDVIAEMVRQPYPHSPPPPPAPEPVDKKRPKITRLKLRVRGGKLIVSWRMSEPGRVTLRLHRLARRAACEQDCRRWKGMDKKTVRVRRRGPRRAKLSLKGAPEGRYRLTARARDRAGNRSRALHVGFLLR